VLKKKDAEEDGQFYTAIVRPISRRASHACRKGAWIAVSTVRVGVTLALENIYGEPWPDEVILVEIDYTHIYKSNIHWSSYLQLQMRSSVGIAYTFDICMQMTNVQLLAILH
jgi:hypothetical protein